jgi:DNA-binding transcriptional regulator YdaS (Cro superfamily)
VSTFKHAVVMFNGAANMARAIGVHRAAVSRWESGDREILEHHQLAILKAGAEKGMDLKELAWAIGVKRCSCCDEVVNDEIRSLMHSVVPVTFGKPAQ